MCRRYSVLPRRQLPQAARGLRVDRADQRGRQQRRRNRPTTTAPGRPARTGRASTAPAQPAGIGSSTRSVSEKFGHAPLHDLLQHEHRQVVEQVRVVDTDHAPVRSDDAAVSDSITSHTRCRLSPPARPAHDANAPSGSPRPHDVPTTHRTSLPATRPQPRAPRARSGSSRRPTGRRSRRPDVVGSESAASIKPHLPRSPDQRPPQPHSAQPKRPGEGRVA